MPSDAPAAIVPLAVLHVTTPEHLASLLRASLRADGVLSAASRPVVLRFDKRLLGDAHQAASPSQ